jgi:hypothetical protein
MSEFDVKTLATISECDDLEVQALSQGNLELAKAAENRKLEIRISHLKNQNECDVFIKNAKKNSREDLIPLVLQRSIEISIQSYSDLSVLRKVEIECLKVLFMYEKLLAIKNGKNNRAAYTWRMFRNRGIIPSVDRIVSHKKESVGFQNITSVGLTLDSFEVVVDRYPESFSKTSVERARKRLGIIVI